MAIFKKKPGADLLSDVEALRVRIVAAQTRLDDTEHMPVSADELRERVASVVDRSTRAARTALDIERFARREVDLTKYDVNLPFSGENRSFGFGAALQKEGLGLFSLMLGRDAVIDKLIASAPEATAPGISAAERDAEIKRLRDELRGLEVMEEQWVRDSELTVLPIPRRPDVRPEIALAKDLKKVEPV